MKRKNYIKIWLLSAVIAGLGAFTFCDNAEYDVLDTHAFIKEALSGTSSKVNVSVDGESKTTLNIHLSDLSTTDNHYKLEVCICQHQFEKKYKKFDFSSEYKKAEVYFNSDSFYSASYASSLPQIPFSSRKSLVLIRYFSIIFTGL